MATEETYAANYRLRIKPFDQTPLDQVDKRWLNKWVTKLRNDGHGARAINSTLTTMSAIFQHAVRNGLLPFNPMHGVERVPENRRVITIPTIEDVRLVAARSPEQYGRNAIMLAALTGLRYGELMALDWNEVDASEVRVVRALDRDGSIKATKTRSERIVPLATEARAALNDQRQLRPRGLVFANDNGSTINRHNFNKRIFLRAYRAAAWETAANTHHRIPVFKFHDLRHMAASRFIAAGATAKQVQTWMGHTKITTTFDTYGHLLEADTTRVLDALDDMGAPAQVIPIR